MSVRTTCILLLAAAAHGAQGAAPASETLAPPSKLHWPAPDWTPGAPLGDRSAAPSAGATGADRAIPHLASEDDDRRAADLAELAATLFPAGLTEANVDYWGVAAGLSPDEIQTLRELYARHAAALAVQGAPELRASALRSAYEWDPVAQRHRPVPTPQLLSLLSMRRDWLEALHEAEAELAKGFLAMVDPERQAAARRLVFNRTFRTQNLPTQSASAGVNLVEVVEESGLDPDEMRLAESMLDDYMRKATAALLWRTRTCLQLEMDRARYLVELGPGWELVTTAPERRSIEEEIRSYQHAMDRTELPLRGLAREALSALAKRLPPGASDAVQDRFWRRAQPSFFDDERGLVELVRSSIEDLERTEGEVDETEVAARRDLLHATRLRLLPLGFEAADLSDAISALEGESRADAAARIRLEIGRLAVMNKRRDICAEAAKGLRAMLTADETAAARRIAAYQRELEAQGQANTWLAARWQERLGELARLPAAAPSLPEERLEQIGDEPQNDAQDEPQDAPGQAQAPGQRDPQGAREALDDDAPPAAPRGRRVWPSPA